MIKRITFLVSILSILFITRPAHALLVGTLSGTDPDTLLTTGGNVQASLGRVNKTSIDDLNTTVTTAGPVDEYKGWLYFTRTSGFWRQKIGTTTTKHLRSGAHLDLIDMNDRWAVISDTSSRGSFWYDASTTNTATFTPKVKQISSATITGVENPKIALIGKNSAGKQKLFISDTLLTSLTELPLPRYAKSCDGVAMSPNNTYLFITCTFRLPGQSSNVNGYVLAKLDHTTITSSKRIISNHTFYDAEWISNSRLVTVEADANLVTSMIYRTVSKGKFTSSESLATDIATTYNNRDAIITPFDSEPQSSTSIYYTYITQFIDGQAPFFGPTLIGQYNLITKTGTIVSDDGTFRYFPN